MFRKKKEESVWPDPHKTNHNRDVAYSVDESTAIDLSALKQAPDWGSEPTGTKLEIGTENIVRAMASMIARAESSIICVMPVPDVELLDLVAQVAKSNMNTRYFITSYWDKKGLEARMNELLALGNVQLRQMRGPGEYWAATRDAEEILISPASMNGERIAGLHSVDAGYCKLYSQFIGPMFQANSTPRK